MRILVWRSAILDSMRSCCLFKSFSWTSQAWIYYFKASLSFFLYISLKGLLIQSTLVPSFLAIFSKVATFGDVWTGMFNIVRATSFIMTRKFLPSCLLYWNSSRDPIFTDITFVGMNPVTKDFNSSDMSKRSQGRTLLQFNLLEGGVTIVGWTFIVNSS